MPFALVLVLVTLYVPAGSLRLNEPPLSIMTGTLAPLDISKTT